MSGDLQPDLEQARAFLELLDPEAAAFTFQTFDDSPAKRPELVRVINTSLDIAARQLAELQVAGAGVFVTINETDLRGRKEVNVVSVRAVFADLDGSPIEPVMACALQPHFTVESSPGRFHAYWQVDGLPLDAFKSVQKTIIARFGGDKAVNDLPRVMRLPGFWHQKGEPFLTRILWQAPPCGHYSAEQILAEFPQAAATGGGAGSSDYEETAELIRQVMTAESFHDPLVRLAWRFLRGGMPARQVTETLQGLLQALPEPHDERWQARFDEIERTVESAAVKQSAPSSWEIIFEWASEKYQLSLVTRDDRVFSEAKGRPLKITDLELDNDIIDRLAKATDAPRLKNGGINRNRLVAQFKTWREVAWGEIKLRLPQEDEGDTVSLSAANDIRQELALLLTSQVQGEGPTPWGHHKRALGTWCHWHASLTQGSPARFASKHAWGMIHADGRWQAGLTIDLIKQYAPSTRLAGLSPEGLAHALRRAGVVDHSWADLLLKADTRVVVDGKQRRITWLTCDFIDDLNLATDHGDVAAAALHHRLSAVQG